MVGESPNKRKALNVLRSSERIHTVGWFTASCLLVSNIIGGGIFTTTGLMARDLGDPMLILLLWTMGGLFAIGGAMVYGELGSRLPDAGGDYVYLREAYGPLVAFLSGWTSFTIGFGAAVAASAISFSAYAFRIVPVTDASGWRAKALSLGLLWLVTLVHCSGLAGGGLLQRMITSTKVLAIGALIVGGLSANAAHWDWLSNRPIGDMMIMNYAFLVARDKESAFDARMKLIGAKYDRLTFKYTGPWPPYNFVNIRLKLERAK